MIDDKKLWDVIAGLAGYQAVIIAHRLDLFSHLEAKPREISDIMSLLNIQSRPAEAILYTNLNLGLLALENGKFQLSDVGKKFLVKSSDTYFGSMFDLVSMNELNFEKLHNAVISNTSQEYESDDIFDSHEKKYELAKQFTEAMHSLSVAPASGWVDKVDLSAHKTFLDIGGGSGAHTISALLKWSAMKGVVFEIPPVCEVCSEKFGNNKLSARAVTHSGNFWEDVYPDADVHFYSQIFHDWPEEKCRFLAEKSFGSLPQDGKIIIHEMLYDDDKNGPFVAAACSVALLSWTEGKQYSGKELRKILQDTGFKNIEIIPTYGYWSIVTASK